MSGNLGACQPSMSSSTSPSLQLESIMFLAATVNESKAASAESGVGTSRAVCHPAIHYPKAGPGCRTGKTACMVGGSLRLFLRESGNDGIWH